MVFYQLAYPLVFFQPGSLIISFHHGAQGFLIGIIPVSIALLSVFLLNESEKWKNEREQIARNKKKRENIFAAYHRYDLIIGSVIFGTMLIGLWAIFSWMPTWIQNLISVGDGQKQRGLSMMMLEWAD